MQSTDTCIEQTKLCWVYCKLSKLHMYDFQYNHMKVKYPHADQLRLLFTDTDSVAYAVQTENIYEDMASDAAGKYDFSEYPINHPLYDTSNRKALGFFKDELNSIPMKEFVGAPPPAGAGRAGAELGQSHGRN